MLRVPVKRVSLSGGGGGGRKTAASPHLRGVNPKLWGVGKTQLHPTRAYWGGTSVLGEESGEAPPAHPPPSPVMTMQVS